MLLTRRALTVQQTVCRALQQDVRLALLTINCFQIKHVQFSVPVISIVPRTKLARTVRLIAMPALLQQVVQLAQQVMILFRGLATLSAKVISIAIPQL